MVNTGKHSHDFFSIHFQMVGSGYKGKIISIPYLSVLLIYFWLPSPTPLFSHMQTHPYFQEVSAFNHTLNLTLQSGVKGRKLKYVFCLIDGKSLWNKIKEGILLAGNWRQCEQPWWSHGYQDSSCSSCIIIFPALLPSSSHNFLFLHVFFLFISYSSLPSSFCTSVFCPPVSPSISFQSLFPLPALRYFHCFHSFPSLFF